ncbi:SCO family protein [Halostagnicola bangensis]
MQRRHLLGTLCLASTVSVAGCLGDDSTTALDPPDHDADPETLPYPTHGEELPTATLPSPLHDRSISTTEFLEERETLLTFVFTRCPGPCHSLTSSLAHVQADALENGYADEVALLPTTFDPEHDTPEELRSFSESNGADPDAENWQFLRPESTSEAAAVINDGFGVGFEEVPMGEVNHDDHDEQESHDDHDQDSDHDDQDQESDHDDQEEQEGDDHDSGHDDDDETTFVHGNLLLLVNRDGYVERAYGRQPPRPDEVLRDLADVRDQFA